MRNTGIGEERSDENEKKSKSKTEKLMMRNAVPAKKFSPKINNKFAEHKYENHLTLSTLRPTFVQ